MRIALASLLLFISCTVLPGQTNVSGTIASNTTWDLAGSPYILESDVLVPDGVTLDIDPGVE
ncbi:MAG: hypothetical protein KDC44_15800, partial [Phaeodactylibacter sp.]|nr:hypothetical protein [Phaeodactylibacter sp.]